MAALALLAGCGQPNPNRSPLASEDPARHARAVEESRKVERESAAAEAAFYRNFGRAGQQVQAEVELDDGDESPAESGNSPKSP